jgi:hypothetical protein
MEWYQYGFVIIFAILMNLFCLLISTNHWNKGKRAVTLLVGGILWNYLWAIMNILFNDSPILRSTKGLGFQAPMLLILLAVTLILRSPEDDDSDS